MKTLKDYLTESEQWMSMPAQGDDFAIELDDGTLIETYIIEMSDNCILLDATPDIIEAISEWAKLEDHNEDDSVVIMEDQGAGQVAAKAAAEAPVNTMGNIDQDIDEAEYQGRKVQLNKKMPGDQKKFKVYVKDPATGNIKKVNFGHGGKTAKKLGQKTMRIRKSNPAARKNFRARHNCDNPGPKTKARYWSCRNW